MSLSLPKEAFVQFVEENKGIIYKVCNSYCANKSERDDLAQEIVYQLWKSFHSYNPDLKFSTWMYRIALNVAISTYRRENITKRQVPFSESLMILEDDTEANAEAENNIRLLQSFINKLKEIDRSIMLLYLDNKSYKEIAYITGISVTNVATKINRIKDKLKTNFETVQTDNNGTK